MSTNYLFLWNIKEKIFYIRETLTLTSIRIPQLAKISSLYRDWLRALK